MKKHIFNVKCVCQTKTWTKAIFTGRQHMTLAVCKTNCCKYRGCHKATLLINMEMSPGENTMAAYREEDKICITNDA